MKRKTRSVTWPAYVVIAIVILNSNCKSGGYEYRPTYSADTEKKKILLFGVSNLSFYNSTDLFVNYINENLKGARVQAIPSTSVAGFDDKLHRGYFDFSIGSGVQALESAAHGYHIIAASVNSIGNGGVVLVNKDSAVNSYSDLRNKTIATVGPPALPGHMLQMLYLKKNGIDVKNDCRLMYVESFESIYLNLYLGRCSAGFSSVSSWCNYAAARPEIASRVHIKWEMPGLINSAILFRNDLPDEFAVQIQKLVLTMHNSEPGKKALARLGYVRYDKADSSSYAPVKNFLKEYRVLVGNDQP
jgi:ABC-type phosphate/phosphonate transport system substrate-binding protein